MGLRINAQVGTSDGITNEAYVRITNYAISKTGNMSLNIETFLNIENSIMTTYGQYSPGQYTPGSMASTRNNQIGDTLTLSLTKQIDKEISVERMVPTQITYTDEDGNTVTEMRDILKTVTETVQVNVADFLPIKESDIFTFAYGKLKEKLESIFGVSNIEDLL
jgi:hypothetical protein